jgi:hypothetical protein
MDLGLPGLEVAGKRARLGAQALFHATFGEGWH